MCVHCVCGVVVGVVCVCVVVVCGGVRWVSEGE